MTRLVRVIRHFFTCLCIFVSFVFVICTVYISLHNSNWKAHFKVDSNTGTTLSNAELVTTYRRGDSHHECGSSAAIDYCNQINIMFLFNDAKNNPQLQMNLKHCVTSLLSQTSQSPRFHIMGDRESLRIADRIFHSITSGNHKQIKVAYHDRTEILRSVLQTVANIHAQLSTAMHHFSDPLFYISLVIHKIMPENITKLIILDADLSFASDIADLFSLFNHFSADQVIGIARENQPVYRNVFWNYRKKHPGTRVGEPPPDGLTGFNSGVVLFDLGKLRQSSLYNSYLTGNNLLTLVKKYEFKGHLGDQDFFTLLSFEYGSLFYILPCGWNRQMCMWWRRDEFVSVFHRYFTCIGPVHIWHSNCNTSWMGETSLIHSSIRT